jgi:hypothetical protein
VLRSVSPAPRYLTAGLLIGCLTGLLLRIAVPGSVVARPSTKTRSGRLQQGRKNGKKEYQGEQPAKWKMVLLTFVPAYILSTILQYTPLALLPAPLTNFIITLLLVCSLTYVIQPLLMDWLARWLFPPTIPQPEPLYRAFLRYKRRQQRQRARVYIY